MEQIDVAVIGGGVTGLAAARALAARGLSVCVLERHARPGLDTSTRNSGVIHAGIYYPPGSLKAKLCVEGRRLLYAFCAEHKVPHMRCGKLIVAHDQSELSALEALFERATQNGVESLEIVNRAFIVHREPAVHAVAAIYSPETGIVAAEALIAALLRSAQALDAIFLAGAKVIAAECKPDCIVLRTDREAIGARTVVNAAGLYADDVSRLLEGEAFTIYPCRGEYAELAPVQRRMINALVYPLPHQHGLGVHLTRTIDGAVLLGPTARYQARKDDYEDGRLPLDTFLEPAQRLLPSLSLADLRLSGSGIRPKLNPPHESFADFLIRRDRDNPRIVHAAGIESPGLTSCLAIGKLVSELVTGNE